MAIEHRFLRAAMVAVSLAFALVGCQRKPSDENRAQRAASVDNSTASKPTVGPAASAEDPLSKAIERRAIEAVNWGIPAVSYDLMYQAMVRDAKGGPNQIVYWSRLPDWKNQTLTPNPDVIYFKPFFNTKDGPMVIEIPPAGEGSINGSIMDAWQSALEDVGTAGVDKGKGGKYLITPPGYKEKAPAGYIVLPSLTYEGFALLRSVLKGGTDQDVANAVAYGKRIKLYPLSQAASPPPTKMVDAVDVVFDSTIPYDLRFYQSLDRMVQAEPWLPRDEVMIDMLGSIGIEKGKSFNPNEKTKVILERSAKQAREWLDARYEREFPTYFDGTHWTFPASDDFKQTVANFYEGPNMYSLDSRGVTNYWAFSTVKHIGAGQFYLMSTRDKAGKPMDGSKNYRLVVPANAPVNQYWSAVVYDRATHAFIRDLPRSSRSSQSTGLQRNADGSVDIYFGLKAPAGKESNWIPTQAGSAFEVLFRLYGPQKPLFNKSWKLSDIEEAG